MNAKKDWIFLLVIVLAAYGFVTEIRNNPAGVLTMIILAGIVLFLIRMFLTGSYPGKGVRSGYRRNAPFRSGTTFHKTKTRPKRKTNLRVIEGKKKPDENNKKYYHWKKRSASGRFFMNPYDTTARFPFLFFKRRSFSKTIYIIFHLFTYYAIIYLNRLYSLTKGE